MTAKRTFSQSWLAPEGVRVLLALGAAAIAIVIMYLRTEQVPELMKATTELQATVSNVSGKVEATDRKVDSVEKALGSFEERSGKELEQVRQQTTDILMGIGRLEGRLEPRHDEAKR